MSEGANVSIDGPELRLEPGDEEPLRNGWKIRGDDFRDWPADRLSRRGRKGERVRERSKRMRLMAERLVVEAQKEIRWGEMAVAMAAGGTSL